ncbi:hypothetical protein Hanom_Chr06g00539331 [Helianthus anomalus]
MCSLITRVTLVQYRLKIVGCHTLYRYVDIYFYAAHDHSRKWCTSTDLFLFYCLLYRRLCTLAHGLAQYFASAHHRQERGFLYGDAYMTVIARSLGHLPEADLHLLPAIEPTRMVFQTCGG